MELSILPTSFTFLALFNRSTLSCQTIDIIVSSQKPYVNTTVSTGDAVEGVDQGVTKIKNIFDRDEIQTQYPAHSNKWFLVVSLWQLGYASDL